MTMIFMGSWVQLSGLRVFEGKGPLGPLGLGIHGLLLLNKALKPNTPKSKP